MGTVKVPKEGMERKSSGLVHGHEPQCLCAGSIPFFEHLVEQKWVKPLNLWLRNGLAASGASKSPPCTLLFLCCGSRGERPHQRRGEIQPQEFEARGEPLKATPAPRRVWKLRRGTQTASPMGTAAMRSALMRISPENK